MLWARSGQMASQLGSSLVLGRFGSSQKSRSLPRCCFLLTPHTRLSQGPADFAQRASSSALCVVLALRSRFSAFLSFAGQETQLWPLALQCDLHFSSRYQVSVHAIMRHPDKNRSVAVESHLGAGQMPSLGYRAAYVRPPPCRFLAPVLPPPRSPRH